MSSNPTQTTKGAHASNDKSRRELEMIAKSGRSGPSLPPTPRTMIGTIFDRKDFNKYPGGINWRRKEEADQLAAMPMPEFLKRIKENAQHG